MSKVKNLKRPPDVIMPYPQLLSKAQRIFNAFIRRRDAEQSCITCGKYMRDKEGNLLAQHACHFYSAGHYTALRFNEDNVHGGCVHCNYFKHGSGNEYRRNLERRIGEQRILLLDSIATRQRVKKWHRIELEQIINEYKNKV